MNTPQPLKCPERAFDGLLEHRDPPPYTPATVPAGPVETGRPGLPREFTLVTHELSLTGAPAIVLELASLLRARGCTVTVLSLADGPLKIEFTKRGIAVETPPLLLERMACLQAKSRQWAEREPRLAQRILHRLAKSLREIADWVWQVRFWSRARGILVVNSAASWPLAVKLPATRKAPAFWYIHERFDPQWLIPGERANSTLQRLAADGRLQMLYGSDATRLHWAGNNYPGQVRYWSGVSQTDDGPRPTPGRRDRRMILNVGTVSSRKGTRTLVDAFALGRAEGLIPLDAELCIVGCPLPSVSAEASDLVRRVMQPDL
ncbi:MAG: hypothetical protein K8S22_11420, partial [Betaproteobacteria bacterium]|nr:hypothetical protein [Betaproteobacteria bacterium]